MKKVLLYCLLFLLFKTMRLDAQTVPYSPMAIEGAHWFYFGESSPGLPFYDYGYSLSIKGDSIYNNQKYKKIYQYYFAFDNVKKTFPYPYSSNGGLFYGLIRDDTLQRKVFYLGEIFGEGCSDSLTNELTLHDFSNININDTLKGCMVEYYGNALIIEKENKVIYNKNRFIFTYQYSKMQPSKIGEGIGFLINGGLFHIFPFEQQLWFTRYCLGTDANCDIITDTKDIEKKESRLNIKINNQFFVLNYNTINNTHENYRLLLYNINGAKIKEINLLNLEETIELELQQEGFLFATLVQNGLYLGNTKILNY